MNALRDAVAGGTAVLVVGAGFAASTTGGARSALWRGLIESGIDRAISRSTRVDQDWRGIVEKLIEYGEQKQDVATLVRAASMIADALNDVGPQAYADWLADEVGSLRAEDATLGQALGSLRLPVLTTNYDTLLETTMGRGEAVWTDARDFQRLLTGDSDAVGHLHGIWHRPESVVFAEGDYQRLLAAEGALGIERAVSAIKSLVYVGTGGGLGDPNFAKLLAWHRKSFPHSGVRHFRLCRDDEIAELQLLHAADNIDPVAYGADHCHLSDFVASLEPAAGAVALSASGIVRDPGSEAQRAMERQLILDSLIAEAVDGAEVTLAEAVMPPVLLPVPHAEYVRARSEGAKSKRPERVDPTLDAQEAECILVVGDDESGVTTAIRWLALVAAKNLGNVAPLYVNFRQCQRRTRPLEEQLRLSALGVGFTVGDDGILPPYVLALDDLTANVDRISDRVLGEIACKGAFSTIIGCKQGNDKEVAGKLIDLGVSVRVRYLGRLNGTDVQQMAHAISPTASAGLVRRVMKVLQGENLPRTPLSVSLLLSILFRGGRVASNASQTAILDQYVSDMLGRGDPHEDSRYNIDQQGREAMLAGLAQFYVETSAIGLTESEAVSALEAVLKRLGWVDSPASILIGLLDRRVLRRSGDHVIFSRHCYLYLFAAKRAGANAEFLGFLTDRSLYFSSVLKAHAALIRHDRALLVSLRPLIHERLSDQISTSPFEILELVALPEIESCEIADVGGDVVEDASAPPRVASGSDMDVRIFDDTVPDDELRPAFPAQDPTSMSLAMRLMRGLDLVSTVLRDSDQIEDLALKRDVLVEVLEAWGVLIVALTEDAGFQEFGRTLAIEFFDRADIAQLSDKDDMEKVLEEFSRVFPAAISIGGIETFLASRRLITVYNESLDRGDLSVTDEVSIGAIGFAYSLREPGWPATVRRLIARHNKQWIARFFFFQLFHEDFVRDNVESEDEVDLIELCVYIFEEATQFSSERQKKLRGEDLRVSMRAERLRRRTKARLDAAIR